jgi:hypothetical protein
MVVSDTEVHSYLNIIHSTGTLIPFHEDKRLSSCHGVVGLDPLLAQSQGVGDDIVIVRILHVQLGLELLHFHSIEGGRFIRI